MKKFIPAASFPTCDLVHTLFIAAIAFLTRHYIRLRMINDSTIIHLRRILQTTAVCLSHKGVLSLSPSSDANKIIRCRSLSGFGVSKLFTRKVRLIPLCFLIVTYLIIWPPRPQQHLSFIKASPEAEAPFCPNQIRPSFCISRNVSRSRPQRPSGERYVSLKE